MSVGDQERVVAWPCGWLGCGSECRCRSRFREELSRAHGDIQGGRCQERVVAADEPTNEGYRKPMSIEIQGRVVAGGIH
jgi:hypothetical protein